MNWAIYYFCLPKGFYTLSFSYIGYEKQEIKDVEVKDWEATFVDVSLEEDAILFGCPIYYYSYKIPLITDISEGNATFYTFDRRGNVE